jgi:serine/threonine-protein kinase
MPSLETFRRWLARRTAQATSLAQTQEADLDDDETTAVYQRRSGPELWNASVSTPDLTQAVSRGRAGAVARALLSVLELRSLLSGAPRRLALGSRAPLLVLAAVVLFACGVVVFARIPDTGSLLVTVAGPSRTPLEAVEIFVDGEKRCDASPCRVYELEPGGHTLRAAARGYLPMADVALKVDSAEESVFNVTLIRASAGSGIRVFANVDGLELYVDDERVGPLPQLLDSMAPGEHRIRVVGNALYEPYERKVVVHPGSVEAIGPLELEPRRAELLIEPGHNAQGASVLLVSDGEQHSVTELPAKIAVPVGRTYEITAERSGHWPFERTIDVSATDEQKTVVVELDAKLTAGAVPQPNSVQPVRTARSSTVTPARALDADADAVSKLNVLSTPPSFALLDGRPIGKTPLYGIVVPDGPHTVVFVHPELGRKSHSVSVARGKIALSQVQFP